MDIASLEIDDVLLIKPKIFGDDRGYFFEFWNKSKFDAAGFEHSFVQDNISQSKRGVLRGLHFQHPQPQGKLVTVFQGDVFDVAVDLRKESQTFGKWVSILLSDKNHYCAFIPPGFAHGFQVLSDHALFAYKCTDFYNSGTEHVLRWDDPDIGIRWPLPNPTVSKKDLAGRRLKDFHASFFH